MTDDSYNAYRAPSTGSWRLRRVTSVGSVVGVLLVRALIMGASAPSPERASVRVCSSPSAEQTATELRPELPRPTPCVGPCVGRRAPPAALQLHRDAPPVLEAI
jgi:hypothetical protein